MTCPACHSHLKAVINNHYTKAVTFCHIRNVTFYFFLFSWKKKKNLKRKSVATGYTQDVDTLQKKIHVHYKQFSKCTEEVDDMGGKQKSMGKVKIYEDKDHRAKSKENLGMKKIERKEA